jgi:hypothetical protein
MDVMRCEAFSSVDSFTPGQRVLTSFGPGIVSAVSHVDSIVFVAMSDKRSSLYLLRPEQIELAGDEPVS